MGVGKFIVGGLIGAAIATYLSRNNRLPEIINKDSVDKLMSVALGKMKNMGMKNIDETSQTYQN